MADRGGKKVDSNRKEGKKTAYKKMPWVCDGKG
jgi:hypothetical protein